MQSYGITLYDAIFLLGISLVRVKKNLKIEESHFYAFSRITRHFIVKHAVKLLVPSSRNESPAQVANIHSVMTLRAERR